MDLYPFILEPVPVPRPWAGNQLPAFLQGEYPDGLPEGIGEWVMLEDSLESRVANGPLAGTSLAEIRREAGADLLGRASKAERFPISIRIRDVGAPQPLRVYPQIKQMRQESHAMFWYSLGGEPGSEVIAGLRPRTTRSQLLTRLGSRDLKDLLEVFQAPFGDSFLLTPGIVHSAGTGCLLLEIQAGQAALGRVGAASQPWGRAMDAIEGLEGVSSSSRQLSRIRRDATESVHTRRVPLVRYCPAFAVDEFRVRDYFVDRTTGQSCHVLCPVRGSFRLETSEVGMAVGPGRVCCLPANAGDYRVQGLEDGCDLIRVIPKVI